jgi:hypothetical protein
MIIYLIIRLGSAVSAYGMLAKEGLFEGYVQHPKFGTPLLRLRQWQRKKRRCADGVKFLLYI